jgi:hypothetical protein
MLNKVAIAIELLNARYLNQLRKHYFVSQQQSPIKPDIDFNELQYIPEDHKKLMDTLKSYFPADREVIVKRDDIVKHVKESYSRDVHPEDPHEQWRRGEIIRNIEGIRKEQYKDLIDVVKEAGLRVLYS